MRLSAALFLSLVLVHQVEAAESLAGSKPNIILVMTDDQGYGQLGRHGHPWLRTPHLDALYNKSVRFTQFLVSPTCSPTRSAMMTGRHPMRNGVTHTIFERERMTLDATILPQVLKQAGYTTGIFGKWHLGDEEPYQPHQRGFDETFIHGGGGIGQAYACSCADAPDNTYYGPIVRHNGQFVKTDGFCTDVFFTAALGWIDEVREADAPFFAYITTNAPHFPFDAPPENAQRFLDLGFPRKQAGFYGMVENIDENIGRLMRHVEQRGLLENTLVIFMSDNGTTIGGAGHPDTPLGKTPEGEELHSYNAGMRGFKGSTFEGGVRVPFFVRWDGRIEPNRDLAHVAAHIDLLPTLAEVAGAQTPAEQVEGRSMLPLIEDASAAWPDRYLYTHVARWKTGANIDNQQWKNFAIRNQRFRLIGENELYDMLADPGQKENVIEVHPDVVAKMRAAYDVWWRDTRPLMVNEDTPMSKTRPFHVRYHAQAKASGIPQWDPPQLP